MKSSDRKKAPEKTGPEKANGRKLNGFSRVAPLFDRESWGVTFPGPGEPMPGPGMYENPAMKEDDGQEENGEKAPAPAECAPKAKKGRNAAVDERPFTASGFFELVEGSLVATHERCAW